MPAEPTEHHGSPAVPPGAGPATSAGPSAGGPADAGTAGNPPAVPRVPAPVPAPVPSPASTVSEAAPLTTPRTAPVSAPASVPWAYQFAAAAVVLAAFLALAWYLTAGADVPDGVWKNRVFVFSSVEALVFTAAGWVFGKEVHRSQVEATREDARTAKQDAAAAREQGEAAAATAAAERAKGMQLAGAVQVLVATPNSPSRRGGDVGFSPAPAVAAEQVAALQDLARRLYG